MMPMRGEAINGLRKVQKMGNSAQKQFTIMLWIKVHNLQTCLIWPHLMMWKPDFPAKETIYLA